MALIVQNDDGDEAGANGYIDATYFRAYHDDRLNDYATFDVDATINAAIIRATDYMDRRFRFVGIRANASTTQTTMWPRMQDTDGTLIVDPDGNDIEGLPTALKQACAEYALRALSAALIVDVPPPVGGRLVLQETKTLGPMSKSTTFALKGALGSSTSTSVAVIPAYPLADDLLKRGGLVDSSRGVFR